MSNIQKQIDKSVEEIMKHSTEIYIGSQSDLVINTTHAISIVKKCQLDSIEVIKGEIENIGVNSRDGNQVLIKVLNLLNNLK